MIARIGDRELGWDDVGRGAPILLFHAFPLDRRMWSQVAERVARKVRTIALDFRGLGESTGIGSIEDAADDGARLLDHLGVARAAVGGLSMGGYVAMAFARRHPRRLSALLLADTRSAPDSEEARAGRDRAITEVATRGVRRWAESFIPKLVAPENHAARDLAMALALLQSSNGVAAALAALRDRPDATPSLSKIQVPTTVITGALDSLIPPSESEKLHAAIVNSQLLEIPKAAHLPAIESPDAFADAIESLLARAPL